MVKSATSLVAHQAGTYLRLLMHEATRSISFLPEWDASPIGFTPNTKFASTHLYT